MNLVSKALTIENTSTIYNNMIQGAETPQDILDISYKVLSNPNLYIDAEYSHRDVENIVVRDNILVIIFEDVILNQFQEGLNKFEDYISVENFKKYVKVKAR